MQGLKPDPLSEDNSTQVAILDTLRCNQLRTRRVDKRSLGHAPSPHQPCPKRKVEAPDGEKSPEAIGARVTTAAGPTHRQTHI